MKTCLQTPCSGFVARLLSAKVSIAMYPACLQSKMARSGGIRIALLLLLWGVMSMTATAQESVATVELRRFVGNMERFGSMFPQEKVYLHFDNTGYFLGETMWFKAYVLRADDNRWTDMSRVLYVELLTPVGGAVDTDR